MVQKFCVQFLVAQLFAVAALRLLNRPRCVPFSPEKNIGVNIHQSVCDLLALSAIENVVREVSSIEMNLFFSHIYFNNSATYNIILAPDTRPAFIIPLLLLYLGTSCSQTTSYRI